MASKLVSVFLCLILVGTSPGAGALFAADLRYKTDLKTGKKTPYSLGSTSSQQPAKMSPKDISALIAQLQKDPKMLKRVSADQRAQAVAFLRRYENYLSHDSVDPETEQDLADFVKDLNDGDKDPGMALAGFFENMSQFGRKSEAAGTYNDILSQSDSRSVVAVRSSILGKTLFEQESVKVGFKKYRNIIRRPDPHHFRKQILDAIIVESEEGSAQVQRVVYNRRVHQLLRTLKKMYYDQPQLARQIADQDPKITEKARETMRGIFAKNQRDFAMTGMLEYLAKLNKHEKAGTLEQLDFNEWKELEKIQRSAMRFYNDNQLQMMQKYVIAQVTSYFSQLTNTQPKQKKDGTEKLDVTMKDLSDVQKALTAYENGDLEGWRNMSRFFTLDKVGRKQSKIDHDSLKDVSPELMALMSEAFADVAYAYKATQRSLNLKLSVEEQDAAIEESQQWLNLVRLQLQSFDLQTLVWQLRKLKDGKLGQDQHMGLDDPKMKLEAAKLARDAQEQYLPKFVEMTNESKGMLLKQSVAAFHLTHVNASGALLLDDTMQERLRSLAAKAVEMKTLYLARRFDAVKEKYKGQAQAKLKAGAYNQFLKNLSPGDAKIARDLDKLAGAINDLARLKSGAEIRTGLEPVGAEFRRLAALLGFAHMPDGQKLQKESQDFSIKQAKVSGALQNFTSNIRIFDMVNELDLNLRKSASSEEVRSDSDGWWSGFKSSHWFPWAKGGDKFAAGVTKFFNPEVYEKLGANKEKRKEILALLAQGNYTLATAKIAALDPKTAAKARRELEADKGPDDVFKMYDFDSFMSDVGEDGLMAQAQAVIVDEFNHLQKYMLYYMGATALVDAVAITGITSLLAGPFAGAFSWGSDMMFGISSGMRLARIAKTTQNLNQMGKMLNSMYKVGGLAKGLNVLQGSFQFTGNVLHSWGRNGRIVVDLAAKTADKSWKIASMEQAAGMAKQLGANFIQAGKFTAGNMLMMGGASGGWQAMSYAKNRKTSQYDSWTDAALEGAVGGANFGAKAGPLFLLSPLPASAFGTSWVGNAMRGLAETPGPISWAVQKTAQLVPRWSESIVAKAGPLGWAQNLSIKHMPTFKRLVNLSTSNEKLRDWAGSAIKWTLDKPVTLGGLVDGTAKYYVVGDASMEAAQLASYAKNSAMEAINGPAKTDQYGATAHMQKLQAAQAFGLAVSQVSWLLLPVNPMSSAKENKVQAESMNSFYMNMWRGQGRAMEGASDGHDISGTKPWLHRTWFWEKFRGEKLERTSGSEQVRQQAAELRIKNNFTDAEVAGVALAHQDNHGRVLELGALVRNMGVEAPVAEKISGAAKIEFSKPAVGDAVEVFSAVNTADARLGLVDPLGRPIFGNAPPSRAAILDSFGKPIKGAESVQAQRLLDSSGRPLGEAVIPAKILHGGRENFTASAGGLVDRFGRPISANGMGAGRAVILDALGKPINGLENAQAKRVLDPSGRPTGETVREGELLYTREAAAAAKLDFSERLIRDPARREAIITAKDVYVFKDKLPSKGFVGRQIDALLAKLEKKKGITDTEARPLHADQPISGKQLERLKEMARMADFEARPLKFKDWAGSLPKRLSDMLSGRRLDTKYDILVRELEGNIKGKTAEEFIRATRAAVDVKIDLIKDPAAKQALSDSRRTIESDAFIRFSDKKLARDVIAFQNGKITEKAMAESIQLHMDVLSKGLLGQMEGTFKGYDAKGEEIWDIPEAYRFTNIKGDTISAFRNAQKQMMVEALMEFAKGNQMVFGLLKTSGGKTLLSFMMLSFMDSYARERGRQGVVYNTADGKLVAQAMEDYMAFFKGRKPSFEIQTYSDLMAKQAEADESGALSPFKTHDHVLDEFDLVGMQTPLSLGSFNGRASFPKIDLFQQALRQGVKEIWGTTFEPGKGGEKGLYDKYGGEKLDKNSFAEMLKKNPKLAEEFSDAVSRTVSRARSALEYMQTDKFKNSIDPALYKEMGLTKEQIIIEMRKEHRAVLGSRIEVGIAERQHGGLKGWVEHILKGAYQARSQGDLSQVYGKDPQRESIIQLHNDVAHDSLDTQYRTALELREKVPINFDFDTKAIVNFRRINEVIRNSGTVALGLSGTMPDGMRPFMFDKMGWKPLGSGTPEKAVTSVVLKPGVTWHDFLVTNVKELAELSKTHPAVPNVVISYEKSMAEFEKSSQMLEAAGIPSSQQSVLALPGSDFFFQTRYMREFESMKNTGALKKGEVRIVRLVGETSMRGLDPHWGAYKGSLETVLAANGATLAAYAPKQAGAAGKSLRKSEIRMLVKDPQNLPRSNFTQLLGRTNEGRIPENAQATYFGVVEAKTLVNSKLYNEILINKLTQASGNSEQNMWQSLSAMLKDKAPAGKILDDAAIKELLYNPKSTLEPALEVKGRELYADILTLRDLKKAIGEARIKEALANPEKIKELAADSKVFDVLVRPGQGHAEKKALESSGIFDPQKREWFHLK